MRKKDFYSPRKKYFMDRFVSLVWQINLKNIIRKVCWFFVFFIVLFFILWREEVPIEHTSDHHPEPFSLFHTHKKDFWETNTDPVQDPLKDFDSGTLQELLDWTHWSAENDATFQRRFDLICTYYKDICGITDWQAQYTIKDKYIYQVLMIFLIKKIDENRKLATNQNLRQTMSSIHMKKSETARRWSAGTTHAKMNTQKISWYQEFFEVFTHEVAGHIHDLWVVDDPYSASLHPKYTEFWQIKFWLNDRSLKFYEISRLDEKTRRADASYEDFISWYAMKNTFEEMAEFTNAWINHHSLLQRLSQQNDKIAKKYQLFQQLFWDRYLQEDSQSLKYFDSSQRVFDTTKPRRT